MGEHSNIRRKFRFLAKMLIFGESSNLWRKFWFFGKNFDFWRKFWFFGENYNFWGKCWCLANISIFDENFAWKFFSTLLYAFLNLLSFSIQSHIGHIYTIWTHVPYFYENLNVQLLGTYFDIPYTECSSPNGRPSRASSKYFSIYRFCHIDAVIFRTTRNSGGLKFQIEIF